MRALVKNSFQDQFLDYFRGQDQFRVQVRLWHCLGRVQDLYFVRPKSLRLLWNYFREIGLKEVLRKVMIRSSEGLRNEKYLSCGVGRVVESPLNGDYASGDWVVFLAPSHPVLLERIVLPAALMITADPALIAKCQPEQVLFTQSDLQKHPDHGACTQLKGWSPYSGEALEADSCRSCLEACSKLLQKIDWTGCRAFQYRESNIQEQRDKDPKGPGPGKKKAVLFGYGNYAQNNIIPNIKPYLDLACIHEVDPLQIPAAHQVFSWDTAPGLRDEEPAYDACFIAGFHHTHAEIALQALERGAYAVVEKPVVTDKSQFERLLQQIQDKGSRFFACFQKRYHPFNALIEADLLEKEGRPFSYYCIVYEVPLPKLHWYRWPNSKSRIISNGCHWIDHFLFLNDYCAQASCDLHLHRTGDLVCSISLQTGSFFCMIMTDSGSPRIGMQEHIELRAGETTLKIENSSAYQAENKNGISRKRQVSKKSSYRAMYRQIGQAIQNGEPGDSLESFAVPWPLILELDAAYHDALKHQMPSPEASFS